MASAFKGQRNEVIPIAINNFKPFILQTNANQETKSVITHRDDSNFLSTNSTSKRRIYNYASDDSQELEKDFMRREILNED